MRGPLASAIAIAAACAAVPALAQEAGPPRDRTGPGAQPLPVPDYATPAQPPAPPVPPPPMLRPGSATVTFSDVTVTREGAGSALPQPDWVPNAEAPGGLRLVHAAGQPLDEAWVRGQFVHNAMIGQPTDYARVVALVQMINRAYLQNGYANSGVLLAPQGAHGGVLALRLVAGRIAGADGASGLAITWRDGRKAGLDERFIAARMPSAVAQPFDAYALERDFRSLADDPAVRTIDASLRPGARPGEATLAVTLDPQRRFDLHATVANNRSPAVGGIRWSAGGSAGIDALIRSSMAALRVPERAGRPSGRRGTGFAGPLAAPPWGGGAEGASGGGHVSSSQVQPSLATMALEAGGPQVPAA